MLIERSNEREVEPISLLAIGLGLVFIVSVLALSAVPAAVPLRVYFAIGLAFLGFYPAREVIYLDRESVDLAAACLGKPTWKIRIFRSVVGYLTSFIAAIAIFLVAYANGSEFQER